MPNKYLSDFNRLNDFINKNITLKPTLTYKEKANSKLRYAVWSGKIKKPKKCSMCGINDKRICGHHHNGYEKDRALDVIWLCDSCHNSIHAKERQAKRVYTT